MKIGKQSEVNGIKDYKLSTLLLTIMNVIDGDLNFVDNIRSSIIRKFYFEKLDFDYPIQHNLGITTEDWVILNQSQYARFANGQVEPTNNRLYLRCDTAGTFADILILG